MRRYVSPLRFPGGKSKLAPQLGAVFGMADAEVWMEPFAGGAGAGLTLLDSGIIPELWLVEKHAGLAAWWRLLLTDGHRFADRVEHTQVDMACWGAAQEVLAALEAGEVVDDWNAGFAAFVTNRCSRSGIITSAAGPIGGKQQTGDWKVGDRFEPYRLAARLRRVADLAGRIRFWEADAVDMVAELNDSGFSDDVFVFVDPPYVAEGRRLYQHSFTVDDHRRLAAVLNGSDAVWLLTYDTDPLVADLYRDRRIDRIVMDYSANSRRRDHELVVVSDNCPRWATAAAQLAAA